MTARSLSVLAIAANLLFWPLLFVLAALRPDYSHLHKAVSELGAVGAPRAWVWNILGFIAPGLMLTLFGWNFVRKLKPRSRWLAGLLALAGLGLVIAGVFPADMANRTNLQTNLHTFGSLLSLLAWVPALIAVAGLTFRSRRDIAVASLAALVATAATFGLYGVLPHAPALVQRVSFAVFFGWYLAAALLLLKPRSPQEPVSAT